MLEKTKARLEREFEVLPKHHIDTSIFLEPNNTEDGRFCRRYLQRVGYNYKGVVSFPVLSELMSIILSIEKYDIRIDMLELIYGIMKTRQISLYSKKDAENIILELNRLDRRIDTMDREIVACAIEDKADILVTLDGKLIRNPKIESNYRIKILHPKDLV